MTPSTVPINKEDLCIILTMDKRETPMSSRHSAWGQYQGACGYSQEREAMDSGAGQEFPDHTLQPPVNAGAPGAASPPAAGPPVLSWALRGPPTSMEEPETSFLVSRWQTWTPVSPAAQLWHLLILRNEWELDKCGVWETAFCKAQSQTCGESQRTRGLLCCSFSVDLVISRLSHDFMLSIRDILWLQTCVCCINETIRPQNYNMNFPWTSSEFCVYTHVGKISIIFFYTFSWHPQGRELSNYSVIYTLWQNGKNKNQQFQWESLYIYFSHSVSNEIICQMGHRRNKESNNNN